MDYISLKIHRALEAGAENAQCKRVLFSLFLFVGLCVLLFVIVAKTEACGKLLRCLKCCVHQRGPV